MNLLLMMMKETLNQHDHLLTLWITSKEKQRMMKNEIHLESIFYYSWCYANASCITIDAATSRIIIQLIIHLRTSIKTCQIRSTMIISRLLLK